MRCVLDNNVVNYLIRTGLQNLLPRIFTEVYAPKEVMEELKRGDNPKLEAVRQWATSPPDWLKVREVKEVDPTINPNKYGLGEREATSQSKSRSESFAYRPVERKLIYPNQFRAIKRPRLEPGKGLVAEAFVSIADVGDGRTRAEGMERVIIDPDKTVPTHVPSENEDFASKWEKRNLEHLRLPKERHSAILDEVPPAGGVGEQVRNGVRDQGNIERLEKMLDEEGESSERDGEFRQVAAGLFARFKGRG